MSDIVWYLLDIDWENTESEPFHIILIVTGNLGKEFNKTQPGYCRTLSDIHCIPSARYCVMFTGFWLEQY